MKYLHIYVYRIISQVVCKFIKNSEEKKCRLCEQKKARATSLLSSLSLSLYLFHNVNTIWRWKPYYIPRKLSINALNMYLYVLLLILLTLANRSLIIPLFWVAPLTNKLVPFHELCKEISRFSALKYVGLTFTSSANKLVLLIQLLKQIPLAWLNVKYETPPKVDESHRAQINGFNLILYE